MEKVFAKKPGFLPDKENQLLILDKVDLRVMMWVMDFCRWIVQVVLRPEQTKGFVLLKKRWVV